jgi:predicted lipoprotein
MQHQRKGAVLAVALLLILAACATTATAPTHPGAINAFDSTAYDTLITVQASLNQAKALITTYPQFKADLNTAIAAYNAAQAAYKTYHAAGAAGSTTALQTQLQALVAQVAALLKNLGVTA